MAPRAVDRSSRPSHRLAGVLFAVVTGATVLGAGLIRSMSVGGASQPDASGAPSVAVAPGSALSSAVPSGRVPASSGAPGGSPQPTPSTGPTGPTTSERRAADLADRLQRELDRVRRQLGIPGVSATILFPDGTRWTGASGFADVAAKEPVTPDTAFAVASISKTFTSALILQLVDEGKLRLGDPAAGLLPPIRLRLDRRITVGMLLNHTSGLADFFLNPKIDGPLQKRPTAAWTVDRTLRYVGKPLSPPGRAWHYSNTNYLLLGLIAEHVTGMPYAELVRTRLLDPAGLGATWVQVGEQARAGLAHGYRLPGTKPTVKPIDLADGTGIAPFRSVVTAAGGAGSLASTSGDLAAWARALYGGRVLGPAGTGLLLSGFTSTTNYVPGVSYGYGVQALSIEGHPSLGHSGRLLGFRGAVRDFPVDGLTIAVLTNQSRADPAVILRRLLLIALPAPPTCSACMRPS
jgi:CubicO group peptidase (beta-lactamase class C family)